MFSSNRCMCLVCWFLTAISSIPNMLLQGITMHYLAVGFTLVNESLSCLLFICCCLVAKSCLIFLQPHGLYLPVCSVHRISQARILEWVAILFSKGSFWPRDQTHVFCIGRWTLYPWVTWEAPYKSLGVWFFFFNDLSFRRTELYKKDLHDPDNHDGVITHLEQDILECEVKWP